MSQPGGTGITILFIEDDAEFVEMYTVALEIAGYEVEVAADGVTGLGMIRDRMPDLVFLDMRMPGLSGLEVLRELRADEATAALPAVVLSNYDEPRMIEEARRLGALEWLVKINTPPRALSERVGSWLRRDAGDR